MKKILFVIPARGGSKGIPGKNIKPMGGIPLICRSIDIARKFVGDKDICVTTDSDEIIEVVKQHGMEVPFKRPDYLATDTASSYDVLIHALDFYKEKGIEYDWMVLLQPTTPFRKEEDLRKMLDMMNDSLDMVVSVKQAETNPYYNCYALNEDGYLQKFIKTSISNFWCCRSFLICRSRLIYRCLCWSYCSIYFIKLINKIFIINYQLYTFSIFSI